jgi:hypothetical protein
MAKLTRRAAMTLIGASALASCRDDNPWNSVDVEGALPALDFTLTRVRDGKLRYRGTYKVIPERGTQPYQVVHGPSVYVFDRAGDARLMIPRFYDNSADIKGVTEDMTRLAQGD